MRGTGYFAVLLALMPLVECDDLFIVNAPSDALAFTDEVTEIKSSQLGAMLSTLSGITPSKGSWDGVRVLSPFRYARVVSVLAVAVSGDQLPADPAWRRYDVTGAADVDVAFHQLDMGLAKQPHTLPAIRLQADPDEPVGAPAAGSLNGSLPTERRLLRELALLNEASARMSSQLGRRRAVLVSLDGLPAAAAETGSGEPARRLADAVARYAGQLADASGGRALTLLLTRPAPVRRARSLLAEPTSEPPAADTLNLASSYSGDYPVIFNILLLTSLFLVYILVAFSVMTAYMDPGKDSIIYRMTNPNMKKSN